jgi:hypothetical protein
VSIQLHLNGTQKPTNNPSYELEVSESCRAPQCTRQDYTCVAQWDARNELNYNTSRIQFKHGRGMGGGETSRILGHRNGVDQLLKITRFGRQQTVGRLCDSVPKTRQSTQIRQCIYAARKRIY